ncbi:sulfite exporter TauE/SafE family protein [Herbiconiux moechotypicola]|uniref:Probable membrane transporter protein n=1 Tax=Herbiconiux moechotypicola TaxID=637393 RepID=A0ABN3E1Y3_9MICO|nr:sulfite exporter TauE/SafE family protein [Herbiconiux moechotypicola]MCS5731381.1 sulfite exporter TauE/SafE family protein [Herbiconiux moechotypicola]
MTSAGALPRPPVWRLAVVGLLGGVLSGLFGVGGGIVMVPLLVLLTGMDQKRASTTSLLAILPASIAGSVTYFVGGQVDLLAGALVAVGGIVGAWAGARLLRRIPVGWLRWTFIVLLVAVAVRLVLVPPARGGNGLDWGSGTASTVLTVLALIALGVVMGVASGLFGIGGGLVMVPSFIALFSLGDLLAKGTSLAAMIPTAASGSLTNLRGGMVSLRDGLVVGAAATAASFGGVALAFLLPATVAAWLFAALLVIAAAQLAVRALRAPR